MTFKNPCVYILASGRCGYIYIGVTSDLPGRYWQHQSGAFEGFAKRRYCKRLVRAEMLATMEDAITREKQLKKSAPRLEDQSGGEREPRLERSGVGIWLMRVMAWFTGRVLERIAATLRHNRV